MKATDYFDKYKEQMLDAKSDDDYEKVILDLHAEMRNEMKNMIVKRNIHCLSSVGGTVKEFNQKWNKVIRLFSDAKIFCPMKVDGFYENEKAIYNEMGAKI